MLSFTTCSFVKSNMAEVHRYLYTLIFYLCLPLMLLRLWWRGRKAPAYRLRWTERLGFVPKQSGQPLWIHAVSVGETLAIVPLVERLQQTHPDLPIVMTGMTPTGAERVEASFNDRVTHLYCPYDLPDALARFIARVQPRACLVVETELWPNMIHTCYQRSIPLLVANARLSARSAKGYGKVATLTRSMLSKLDALVAQHQDDAERFKALGLSADKISVSGSIKFDVALKPEQQAQAERFREAQGDRPTVLLASSHEGEETQFLAALTPLWQSYPDLLLMIVPRHPERFNAVWTYCQAATPQAMRRSESLLASPQTQVYLADTMGELMMLYAAADIALVGGSLIERGGHNPLEPALNGLPVLVGAHHFNFAAITTGLINAGGAEEVSSETLQDAVARLLANPEKAQSMGAAAQRYALSQQGALTRLHQRVESCLLSNRKE